ncbi:Uncharacterised protein [Mycobacteroides abscessus subsp. abscessus]|nr:Uncharacterised protein [Mycobacteroides abscessus subsp. abscessus]SKS52386.1 Uncharacterised protein [Mycobacteroides abscessus subsp. abscessus]
MMSGRSEIATAANASARSAGDSASPGRNTTAVTATVVSPVSTGYVATRSMAPKAPNALLVASA